jgi:pyrroloquinoline quinone biosynthesis protein B
MNRFAKLPAGERSKIHFIHLNHTNPALAPEGNASRKIETSGMRIARQGGRFVL